MDRHPSRSESNVSSLSTHNVQAPDIPDLHAPGCEQQEQGNDETSKRQDQDRDALSVSAIQMGEKEATVITNLRATDVSLGLKRMPAAFHVIVRHSGLEWRTDSKRTSTKHDVVEWDVAIPIPSDPSATMYLDIYASFELQPTLGLGEELRKLTLTVGQLVDRSERDLAFAFSAKDGDVVSPCSSLLVTVSKWNQKACESSTFRFLDPRPSPPEWQRQVENATDQGHSALSRYRKHGERRDLDQSIGEFERALNLCPLDHPCCAAAKSNIAFAKFIQCQVDDVDLFLDIPLTLYHDALAIRPVGHPDRPSTLIQLATVHLVQFDKLRDETILSHAEVLLNEVKDLSSAENPEHLVANFMLKLHGGRLHGGRQIHAVQRSAQSSLQSGGSTSSFTSQDQDLLDIGAYLLHRFEQRGVFDDLQQAISILEAFLSSTSNRGIPYVAGLSNLGVALLRRFRHLGELSSLDQAISRFRDAIDLMPDNHPDKPGRLSNLGISFRARFERLGEFGDLDQAISSTRDAVDLAPDGHPEKPGFLSNLGNSFKARFECFGELGDLEKAISMFNDAVNLTPDGQHHKSGRLSNLSHSFLTRFRLLGQLSDLEQAISRARQAVGLTPDSYPDSHGHLNHLGNSLLARFEHLGELEDLEQAILSIGEAVEFIPDRHLDKPGYLSNLGSAFLTRFELLGELDDLEEVISKFQHAVDLTPDHHPQKSVRLNNLGSAFLTQFQRLGELADLRLAITWVTDAVHLTPDGHPDKPNRLSNLGSCFKARFERLEELSDLEQAISKFRLAVDLTPTAHSRRPHHLSGLGDSFLSRFQRLGELSDLEQAISWTTDAVDLIPDGHPDKPGHLTNLGCSLITRFRHFGELGDLEQAVVAFKHALDLTPDGHPQKPSRLSNLGSTFLFHFQCFGELSDLEKAISRIRDAIDLTADDHPSKPGSLSNLSCSFLDRFERLGELGDLEQAISRATEALYLTPDGHPDRPICLGSLGNSFLARFERLGSVGDLEQAISTLTEAADLTRDGHPLKAGCLNNLGNSFAARFEQFGELDDVEQAISRARDAVHLTPNGHPQKPSRLRNLSNSFLVRFKRLGEVVDLDHAISRVRDSVDLTPDDHPDKPRRLSDLGYALKARFEHLGELSDLEQAISWMMDAVDLIPDGHIDRPGYLGKLGNSLTIRFERLGVLRDLEHAILRIREAVNLTPDDHPHKPTRLSNLSNALRVRFERLGELGDLDQAISRSRNAVDLTPNGHPQKPTRLNNLGNSFLIRFQRLEELSDLEQAILTFKDAVELTPDGHTHKPTCLNNLGNSFLTRFECLKLLNDLEQAVLTFSDAVGLIPDGHPHKPNYLSNLGNSFLFRFDQVGELGDLEQAISRIGNAVELTPDGHPDKPAGLVSLGNSFLTRFHRLGEISDLKQAMSIYSHATRASIGPPSVRFHAAKNWISCARDLGHDSLLDAYSSAINLLPQMAWMGVTLTTRYHELLKGVDVVREAAAAALDLGRLQTAVEWLEQGRSIIWGELFQLRSSYEELESVHPEHAHRLQQLSAALDNAGATREKSLSFLSEHHDHPRNTGHITSSLEEEATRHCALAIDRDQLLQEIRGLPGFERFLLHKEFSQLRASAHSGPVVILNAAESRCDALIVLADVNEVMHVPLLNFVLKRLEGLQTSLKSMLHLREGRRVRLDHKIRWKSILSTLWKSVVKPVLEALKILTPGNSARIFWCPTGPFTFLPIHAAGLYDEEHLAQPGNKLSDFVISSYIPTLSILAPPREPDSTCSGGLRFLAVRQPPSDGLSPLPGVNEELEYIKEVVQNSSLAQTTLLESSVGTVEDVLRLMKEADWVHFACHGTQDDNRPIDSGLCLTDGRRLKLSDMIGLSRPRGGLAFLSACETAMGDKSLSDEAIHIAAGMLFAGYEGVIATMWSISDRIAPRVAKEVYEQLFRHGTRPDAQEAARALQDTAGRIRDDGASFEEWLPFIHVGH